MDIILNDTVFCCEGEARLTLLFKKIRVLESNTYRLAIVPFSYFGFISGETQIGPLCDSSLHLLTFIFDHFSDQIAPKISQLTRLPTFRTRRCCLAPQPPSKSDLLPTKEVCSPRQLCLLGEVLFRVVSPQIRLLTRCWSLLKFCSLQQQEGKNLELNASATLMYLYSALLASFFPRDKYMYSHSSTSMSFWKLQLRISLNFFFTCCTSYYWRLLFQVRQRSFQHKS